MGDRTRGLKRGGKAGRVQPPRLLLEYRQAYKGLKADRDGGRYETLFRLMDADPKGFLGQMKDLEKEYLALKRSAKASGEVATAGAVAADPGGERLLTTIEELLTEALTESQQGGS